MDYNTLASDESVARTVAALKERNVEVIVVSTKEEALDKAKSLIPPGVSVMNGASVTLEQMGFVGYLKSGEHGWNNLHDAIVKETDKAKQSQLRRQALLADNYLGSVSALSETGQFINASNTGSQLPHIVYSSKNLIFVVSTKKIVPTLQDAFDRLEKYVLPLEEEHMQKKYGVGTYPSKIVITNRENPMMGRKVTMILVKEDLGF